MAFFGQLSDVSFKSAALSQFWGQPTAIHASVYLPDSYGRDADRRYPTIYVVPAFNGGYHLDSSAAAWQSRMRRQGTDFIVVSLEGMVQIRNESLHQEYADSVNTGPWGTALTTEFIPEIDSHFRTIAAPGGRFLFGHSSGGWSVLWLQVNYPDTFGGAWALSPDPVDFHDFGGPDLTRSPPQNFYQDDAGNQYGIDRSGGRDVATMRSYIQSIAWMRRQVDTWDAVFGPRNADGTVAPLFDLKTGAIDPNVAAYWEAHYDITHIIEERWSEIGPKLEGKLHVYVGMQDTYHLEGAVALMRDAIAKLGGKAEIEFAPGADHQQIYLWHQDMINYAMSEMKADLAAGTAASTGNTP